MKKILIVEDNSDMQEIYKDLLKDSFEVIVVGTTKDAEEKLKQGRVDLMILDIVLPGESGDAFLARVKEIPKYSGLSVIAVTVLGDLSEHLQRIHEKVICIPKPFEKEDLIKAITKMVK
ncbi:response regulator [Nanoarchaeota archaeon]